MRKRVIIADDDEGMKEALQLIFERAGYAVTIFSNGEPLLAGAFEVPDIFILDKQLSGVDGLDVCRFLKEDERTQDVPVIMLSASLHIKQSAALAGADDSLEKPFRMRELLDMVSRHLERGLVSH